MTKYEETEIYCDRVFEKLSTMNESEVRQYLSKLDEGSIIFSLKRQVSRIRRTLNKQQKALGVITKNIDKKGKNPGMDQAKIEELKKQIARETKLIDAFLSGKVDDTKGKNINAMNAIAIDIDEKSSTLKGTTNDGSYSSKSLLDAGKDSTSDAKSNNSAASLLSDAEKD